MGKQLQWLQFVIVRNRFAFVATFNSFAGNREIKASNKTKKEIVAGFSPRVTTPSRACEPVLKVETDLADSEAQS